MAEFKEVVTLRDPDGIVCVVTEKQPGGTFSFSIAKEFEKDGKILRTSFLNRRHTTAVRRLLDQIDEWIDRETDRNVAKKAAAGRGTVA